MKLGAVGVRALRVRPVFPRIRAGASLKHVPGVRSKAAPFAVFPRIRAGASLKQGLHHVHQRAGPVFPRIRAGASLKQPLAVAQRHAVHRFPPHSCGGLIEARSCSGHTLRNGRFSPAFVRGPH